MAYIHIYIYIYVCMSMYAASIVMLLYVFYNKVNKEEQAPLRTSFYHLILQETRPVNGTSLIVCMQEYRSRLLLFGFYRTHPSFGQEYLETESYHNTHRIYIVSSSKSLITFLFFKILIWNFACR